MSEEEKKYFDAQKKKEETELGFHWDQDLKVYVCERCGVKWLFRVNMIKHTLEHLANENKKGGGDANRR